ncbi:glycosyltransferase family 2 protein [Pedobacter insulae]|uniref:Alpha-1,3-rhamnosyltransferase n=1 Tax=Pedobacter insulae TaxID=414048 RepID=A0A1I2YT56_9SPHI|nr:glycosyltransferase [Pedobacter insulae]SFH28276.1 alpha-1,3-rhamnosyltransferase [Pedobacter insulae]
MNALPLVSVIVPCYNHEQYVEECILSILNQRYQKIELIVIDDGSTDNSAEVIRRLQTTYDFIFEVQTNIGLSATLNKAIMKYANGAYIAFVASDDYWHPDKISEQIMFMQKNPDCALVCSKAFFVNGSSTVTGEFNPQAFKGSYSFKEIAYGKCLIPALTVLIQKDILNVIGLFDEDLLIEDLDMWLRIAAKYRVGFIDKKLAYYRTHDNNTSNRVIDMAKARFKILKKWTNLPAPIFNKIKRNWELQAIKEFGKTDFQEAKKYFNPTFSNFLNSSYRKLILRYYLYGHF